MYNNGNNTYWEISLGSFAKGDTVEYTVGAAKDRRRFQTSGSIYVPCNRREHAKQVALNANSQDHIVFDVIPDQGTFSPKLCACNGVQREHNKKLNNGLPILHKVPPKRDYGRYFCIMAEKGGTSHGGLTEKLSLFFHAKKQEVNAYGR